VGQGSGVRHENEDHTGFPASLHRKGGGK